MTSFEGFNRSYTFRKGFRPSPYLVPRGRSETAQTPPARRLTADSLNTKEVVGRPGRRHDDNEIINEPLHCANFALNYFSSHTYIVYHLHRKPPHWPRLAKLHPLGHPTLKPHNLKDTPLTTQTMIKSRHMLNNFS